MIRYTQNKRMNFLLLCTLFFVFPILPCAFAASYYYLNDGVVHLWSYNWANPIIHILILSFFIEGYTLRFYPFIRSIDVEKYRLIVSSLFSTREIPMNSIEKIELRHFFNYTISGISIECTQFGNVNFFCINDADTMVEGILTSLKSIQGHRDIVRDRKRRSVRFARIHLAKSTLR